MKSASHVARGRLGGLRNKGAAPERIEEARRELKAAVTEDYIRRTLAEAPPLSDVQRQRLAELLSPSSDEGAAA